MVSIPSYIRSISFGVVPEKHIPQMMTVSIPSYIRSISFMDSSVTVVKTGRQSQSLRISGQFPSEAPELLSLGFRLRSLNPFVYQVNFLPKSKAVVDAYASKKSQSLRISGQFPSQQLLGRTLHAELQSQSLRISGQFPSKPVKGAAIMPRTESQSLRISGQFPS